MSIGTRIKAARQAAGLNQEQLAKVIGVSKGSIGNYEADISHPKEDILIALMTTLNVDANYIYQDYIETKKAPTERLSESDFGKQRLIHNYDKLNQEGKNKLISYSDDLSSMPKYTEKKQEMIRMRAIARGGQIQDVEIEKEKAMEILARLKEPHSDLDG